MNTADINLALTYPTCDSCRKDCIPSGITDNGYGTYNNGDILCFACCAERDKAVMRKTGRAVLYLKSGEFPKHYYGANYADGKVVNWPGTLSIPCRIKKGSHNIAGTRYDVWFIFEGHNWHGVQYGENTQICRCRRLK